VEELPAIEVVTAWRRGSPVSPAARLPRSPRHDMAGGCGERNALSTRDNEGLWTCPSATHRFFRFLASHLWCGAIVPVASDFASKGYTSL
jgi:hypothetical protein